MRLLIFAATAIVLAAPSAFAQTEWGRSAWGGLVTLTPPPTMASRRQRPSAPVVTAESPQRVASGGRFHWFRANLELPAAVTTCSIDREAGDGRRQLHRRFAEAPEAADQFFDRGGTWLNKAEFRRSYVTGAGETISAKTSLAVRPGVR